MKLRFLYDKEKDIWCLLNKGKSSKNSSVSTEVYKKLVAVAGENPDEQATALFIDDYIREKNYNIPQHLQDCQKDFELISKEHESIAEKVFGVSLDQEITVYVTINNRCPYNITESWFFVSISEKSLRLTIMHELWHFYTWYKFGVNWGEKLGKQKYNDLKEALTVLLNVECKDLLPAGMSDRGYPQHQELRNRILESWSRTKNIEEVWKEVIL